ncbi:hypothetical protein LCGC14_3123740, partial [marine sediment metagenome]
MQQLFKQPEEAAPTGRVVGLAVAANVYGTFDYLWPDALGQPVRGQRVRVPFGRGNRKLTAVVVDTDRPAGRKKLKAVAEVVDPESLFDDVLWQLGQWITEYYLTPPGMALAAMIPSAVGRHAPKMETVVFLTSEPADWPHRLGALQKRVLDELLEACK